MIGRASYATRRRRIAKRCGQRRGTATVELAVCLPVLALLVFGSIQASDLIYLKHSVTAAAYEGSLELSKTDSSNANIEARIQQVLDARGITSTTYEILPAGTLIERTPPGTTVTVVVNADSIPNLMLSGFFYTPATVTGQVVTVR
ncbi:MAG: TadE/TadG family type IV pilus assembly protein [Aeoliella sp.]